eukprot:TRINITY_DN552_c0_g1_i1.p1 TRINITY_DN552_c0_g1~~TRINITY_DN552_c0_g1_i1.p1  ORF type:complete len:139 (-),score=7.39 TRINITY_DN552_c0_g1_i1:470-886(-)
MRFAWLDPTQPTSKATRGGRDTMKVMHYGLGIWSWRVASGATKDANVWDPLPTRRQTASSASELQASGERRQILGLISSIFDASRRLQIGVVSVQTRFTCAVNMQRRDHRLHRLGSLTFTWHISNVYFVHQSLVGASP